jgi:type I restriction enzyme R subunit
MIEFKQIIGRGTRLFDNKNYFTLYDFVGASEKFFDKEWDGEAEIVLCGKCGKMPCICLKDPKCSACGRTPCICLKNPPPPPLPPTPPPTRPQKIIIKLADGKERRIFSLASTLFIDKNGNFVSAEQFVKSLYGDILNLCENEDKLRAIWRDPDKRKNLLDELSQEGYDAEKLKEIQKLIDAKDSDIFDVLAYIAFAIDPITRKERAKKAQEEIVNNCGDRLREFLEFVLSHYEDIGIEELESENLPHLMELKYKTIEEAIERLGCSEEQIRATFLSFQGYLY